MLLFALSILVVEHLSPRLWCRSPCPLGAFYGVVGRLGRLQVRVRPSEAGKTACEQCTRHCPMGIRVMEDCEFVGKPSVDHPDCTRYGACIDACPHGVLKLRFTGVETPGAGDGVA